VVAPVPTGGRDRRVLRAARHITLLFDPTPLINQEETLMTLALDTDAVKQAINRALISRIDTPRAEMDDLAAVLTECTRLLLPSARIAVGHMTRSGVLRVELSNRLDSIRLQAETGLGAEGRYTTMLRLRRLAHDCQWLMIRYGPGIS
jgi:hypothetical protein